MADELPPAGWYDDPENSTQLRYWDGRAWTEHRRLALVFSTGETVPGYRITKILGLCAGFGNTYIKLFNSTQSRNSFEKAKADLTRAAAQLEADAVIAVKVSMQSNENGSNLVMLTGTAVKVEPA